MPNGPQKYLPAHGRLAPIICSRSKHVNWPLMLVPSMQVWPSSTLPAEGITHVTAYWFRMFTIFKLLKNMLMFQHTGGAGGCSTPRRLIFRFFPQTNVPPSLQGRKIPDQQLATILPETFSATGPIPPFQQLVRNLYYVGPMDVNEGSMRGRWLCPTDLQNIIWLKLEGWAPQLDITSQQSLWLPKTALFGGC